ncbi:MAG TPA: type II toxin-antitoxin system antitoxin SocA domain-containing protein [Terriglobia bacterium]|nr:type II toxin-antitoxin system antitoxin SocA domain-containing protein [Terriglobia bacterium]
MAYSAKAIANYFLDAATEKDAPLDPMKIQKLVYFAHGWCLALKNAPLINERIEAWRYGPVIRSLYNTFRDAGSGPITHPAYDARMIDHRLTIYAPSIEDPEEGPAEREFYRELLNEIWKVYGDFTAVELSNLTHQPGTPWDKTWDAHQATAPISDDLIKEYFKAQIAKA